jgi:hypothetical protein
MRLTRHTRVRSQQSRQPCVHLDRGTLEIRNRFMNTACECHHAQLHGWPHGPLHGLLLSQQPKALALPSALGCELHSRRTKSSPHGRGDEKQRVGKGQLEKRQLHKPSGLYTRAHALPAHHCEN